MAKRWPMSMRLAVWSVTTLLAMCTRTFGEMVGTMRCVETA